MKAGSLSRQSMRSGDLDAKAEVLVKRLMFPVTPAAAGPGEATSTSPSFGCAQEERLTQLSPPLLATQPQEVPRPALPGFNMAAHARADTRSRQIPLVLLGKVGPTPPGRSLSPQQSSVFLSHRGLCRARRDGRFFFLDRPDLNI